MNQIPSKTRKLIWERSGRICEAQTDRCVRMAKEINHIKSRARGGSNEASNLMAVCLPCHRAITDNRPGTEKFRTHAWQPEGRDENDNPVILKDFKGMEWVLADGLVKK